ncbi:MAG: alpha/beta hydrolase [Roseiarcus sp.]
MALKLDVSVPAEGGIELGAWLFLPERDGPHAAITMAHGFAGTKEHGLERFAQAFAAAGFVVLVHDHRNFGTSGGGLRGDIDPWRQIADRRRALSYLEARSEVDPARIGLWGTSNAGGHALVLGATDRRLRCVVAQVPTMSGHEQGLRRVSPDATPALEHAFDEDERAVLRGEQPRRQAVVSGDPSVAAAYRSQDAIDFFLQPISEGLWKNEVTLRSTRAARMYEPGAWVSRVSPTPLLMVVASNDKVTVADLALAAYERALEPTRLALIPGGHFDPYLDEFRAAEAAATEWFREHLIHPATIRSEATLLSPDQSRSHHLCDRKRS